MNCIFHSKNKNLIIFLVILFSLTTVYAQEPILDIKLNISYEFSYGDILEFDYSISSNMGGQVKYVIGNKCPTEGQSFYLYKSEDLKPNIQLNSSFDSFYIDPSFEPQTCTAYVQILSPIQKIVSKEFQIITNPSFSFEIKLDKKVFTQGENIYLDYSSSVENPSITATLIYPDGSTKNINFPTTIKANQIGTYNLEVTASKEGYKDISFKEQFGVIKSEADINFDETSDFYDGSNKEVNESKLFKNNSIFYILGGSLVLLILLIIIFFIVKKKNVNVPSVD